jgi:hypothetical protein
MVMANMVTVVLNGQLAPLLRFVFETFSHFEPRFFCVWFRDEKRVSRELPLQCFVHPLWPSSPLLALEAVGSSLADELADPQAAAALSIDTEFSGTSLTAVVNGRLGISLRICSCF